MNVGLVVVLSLLIIVPIVAGYVIKPDGRYHCLEPGCNRSFEALGQFLDHLSEEHYYSDAQIAEILKDTFRFRNRKLF